MNIVRIVAQRLKPRVLLFFVLGTLIVLSLVVFIMELKFKPSLMEIRDELYYSSIAQSSAIIDSELKYIVDSVISFSSDSRMAIYMRDILNNHSLYPILTAKIKWQILFNSRWKDFENITVLLPGLDPINCVYGYFISAEDVDDQPFHAFADGPPRRLPLVKVDGAGPYDVLFYMPVYDNRSFLGFIRFDVNDVFGPVFQRIEQDEKSRLCLVDQDGTIIYANAPNVLTPGASFDEAGLSGYMVTELSTLPWRFLSTVPNVKFRRAFQNYANLIILVLLTVVGIFSVYVFLTLRSVLKPLGRIHEGIARIETGDLGFQLELDRYDEFNAIIISFNNMVGRVRTLLKEVQQHQASLYEAQIRAIQASFNPHFLYNTLDMIYWRLLRRDDYESAETVMSLSSILRYSITYQEFALSFVRDEIEQMRNYLTLLQKRYEGRFEWSIDISVDLYDFRIPVLLFQPLLENSVKHGLTEERTCFFIGVTGAREADRIVFTVNDNGAGMDSQEIERILNNKAKSADASTMIGLNLVESRIKYYFGPNSKLEIVSEANKGCTIRVVIDK